MSIEFLDFCFLNDYEKSRIVKIPKEVFPVEENVILDLDIGQETVTIKRNRKQADKPILIREGKTVSFDKIQDARDYAPLRLRAALVPVANFGSQISWLLIILGIVFGMAWSVLRLPMPRILDKTVSSIGAMATPLGLIYICWDFLWKLIRIQLKPSGKLRQLVLSLRKKKKN